MSGQAQQVLHSANGEALHRDYAVKVLGDKEEEDLGQREEDFSDSDEELNQVEDMLNAAEREERRVWRRMRKVGKQTGCTTISILHSTFFPLSATSTRVYFGGAASLPAFW